MTQLNPTVHRRSQLTAIAELRWRMFRLHRRRRIFLVFRFAGSGRVPGDPVVADLFLLASLSRHGDRLHQ